MKGSLQRVRDVMHGRKPDRAPLFELIRNDAVVTYFAGRTLTVENAREMDIAEIHRRHPALWMAGGIDVSQLLPFGKPQEVADAVTSALDAAEGKIMIGSSTELQDTVPLENFLAMRDAVLNYRY